MSKRLGLVLRPTTCVGPFDHLHLARWYDGIGNGPLSERLTDLQASLYRVFHMPTAPDPEADRQTEAALRKILENMRRRPGWIPGPGEDG